MSAYQERIAREFDANGFAGVPLEGRLYARVYYFCPERPAIDTDNLSKPVVDALIGRAYMDDNRIAFRAAAAVNMRSLGISELDVTRVPDEALSRLLDALDNGEHTLYIEVGVFDPAMMLFGR